MEGIVSLYNYITAYLVAILFTVTTALVFIIFTHLHGRRHINQFKTEKDINELIAWTRYLQKWTHSTGLELVWTIIPTIILIAIAIPSFILLYSLDEIVDTQCVIKIIAYQWYWKFEYPVINLITDDVVNFSYLSYMLPLEDLTEEDNLRLLEVDTPMVLPINVNAKLVITSKDVIHSFAVPALGIKMDAIPGRLNQVTLHAFKPGTYYGQCSELCGVNHAFMPIVINAIEFPTYERFLTEAIEAITGEYHTPFKDFVTAISVISVYTDLLKSIKTGDVALIATNLENLRHERNEMITRLLLTFTPNFLLRVELKPYFYDEEILNNTLGDVKDNPEIKYILDLEAELLKIAGVTQLNEFGLIPTNEKVPYRVEGKLPFFETDKVEEHKEIFIPYIIALNLDYEGISGHQYQGIVSDSNDNEPEEAFINYIRGIPDIDYRDIKQAMKDRQFVKEELEFLIGALKECIADLDSTNPKMLKMSVNANLAEFTVDVKKTLLADLKWAEEMLEALIKGSYLDLDELRAIRMRLYCILKVYLEEWAAGMKRWEDCASCQLAS